jgi:hypothetical protein
MFNPIFAKKNLNIWFFRLKTDVRLCQSERSRPWWRQNGVMKQPKYNSPANTGDDADISRYTESCTA